MDYLTIAEQVKMYSLDLMEAYHFLQISELYDSFHQSLGVSCGVAKVLEFNMNPPLSALQFTTPVHFLSPMYELKPMNICCHPLREET